MFTLCHTCADINNQHDGNRHDSEATVLTGVWISAELNKARELGYKLEKITEVWHFENRDSSIFVKYMHIFLTGKQEVLGYPARATDKESRER